KPNRVGAQCRDPIQAVHPAQFLVDPPTRNHPAVADEYDALDTKSMSDLPYLSAQCLGVRCVTREHFDCNRASLRVTQQTVDDLGKTSLAVAVVTELDQPRAMARVVAAGHVIENECPVREMLSRQLVFDARLSFQKPVQRAV